AHRLPVRGAVAHRDPGCPAARLACGRPLPRAPLRGPRGRTGTPAAARLRTRVASVGTADARVCGHQRGGRDARAPEPRAASDSRPPRLADPDEPRGRARVRRSRGRRTAELGLRAARAELPLSEPARATRARPLRGTQPELERDGRGVSVVA